jgi:FkbM family methyltransferase
MLKKFIFLFFRVITLFDTIIKKITKKSFLIYFNEFVNNNSYKSILILNNSVKFFVPNKITEWRVNTFFLKEPETLEWIDSFNKKNKIIFWDIGGNIGLYSIYAALKHSNIEIITFEPSTTNLRVLSRNIFLNKLEDKIKICQLPLTNKDNCFLLMKENGFEEGGALNSFGENYGYNGEKFISNYQYKIFGTSINYILDNNILEVPNYIKIDVDGIEHLILEGGSKYLKHPSIRSLSVEVNENFFEQFNSVNQIMKKNHFLFKHKKKSSFLNSDNKYDKTFNYVFEK